MTLPLRIELAMTFKAVFPDISGPGPIRTWASFRPAKRFRAATYWFYPGMPAFYGRFGRP